LKETPHLKEDRLTGQRFASIQSGFSLLEVCVAVVVLSLAILPMLNAFSPAVTVTGEIEEIEVLTCQARKTLSRLTTLNYQTLLDNQGDPVNLTDLLGSESEATKESFTLNGKDYSPTVAIADASGGVGGLLKLSVTIDHVLLATLKAEY
jgi:prepilin-type N-terminal cleavage/methylation domain-containing protein